MSARRLRLLVVGLHRPVETFLRRLLEGLDGRGIHVAAAGPGPAGADLEVDEWIRLPAWSGNPAARLARLACSAGGAVVRSAPDLARMRRELPAGTSPLERCRRWNLLFPLAGRRFDVLYFPWNAAAIRFEPLFALGKPVVISCRGAQVNVAPHNPRRSEIRGALQRTFSKAARVHCVSRAILEEASRYGLDPEKARVIRPAVDPGFFRPAPKPAGGDSAFRIITTGSMIWRKGYEYALTALKILLDRGVDARFEIIGDGPERARVLYSARDLGIADRVVCAGTRPPGEVLERLRGADVFLLSSLSEGISNAVLEAMACGMPVVTTDCGGMREAVNDGIEGFVVPVRDPQAAAGALHRLAADPDTRNRMGRAGRDRVLREFRLRDQVAAFAELLHEAASAGR